MALLWVDSFDHYATADILQKWPVGSPPSGFSSPVQAIGVVGRRGSNGIRLAGGANTGNSGYLQKTFTTSGSIAIMGVAFKWASGVNPAFMLPINESPCILSVRLNGTTQVWVGLNVSSGLLEIYRGTTLLGTSSLGVSIGNYAFIEMLAVIGLGTAGSVQLRINGNPAGGVSATNTAGAGVTGWNQAKIGAVLTGAGSGGPNMEWHMDDFYVCDGSGAAPFNTFLGDCSVVAGMPTAEGAASDWAPSAGADNSLLVKEAAADGDATYVSTITPGAVDTYVVPDLTPGAALYGVQVTLQLRKEDAGSCAVAAVARVGGTNYPIAVLNPSTGYSFAPGLFIVNPATGLPWTEAEFNAAEFGFARG